MLFIRRDVYALQCSGHVGQSTCQQRDMAIRPLFNAVGPSADPLPSDFTQLSTNHCNIILCPLQGLLQCCLDVLSAGVLWEEEFVCCEHRQHTLATESPPAVQRQALPPRVCVV